MKTAAFLLAATLALLAASPRAAAAPAKSTALAPAAAPAVPATAPDILAHILHTNDVLNIAVFQEDGLSTHTRVNSNGMVNLNLVKEVRIAGLTVADAQKAIEKAYRDGRFLRHPQVTINIEDFAPQYVSIQGDVRTVGRHPLPIEEPMTVVELVMKVGLTDTADGNHVRITHFNAEGKPEVREVPVQDIIKGKSKIKADDKSLILQPDDIVWVPMSIF